MNFCKYLILFSIFTVGVVHTEYPADKYDIGSSLDELRGGILKLRDKTKAFIVDACLNGKAYDQLNDKDKQKFLELVALFNDIVFSEKYGNVVEKLCLNMSRVLYEKKIDSLVENNFVNNALLTGLLVTFGWFLFFK